MLKDLLDASPIRILLWAALAFLICCPALLWIAVFFPDFFQQTDTVKLLAVSLGVSVPLLWSPYHVIVMFWVVFGGRKMREALMMPFLALSGALGMVPIYFTIMLKNSQDLQAETAILVGLGLFVAELLVLTLAIWKFGPK